MCGLSIISRSLLNARGKHRGTANVIPYERLNQTQHSCPLRGKGLLTKDGRKFLEDKKRDRNIDFSARASESLVNTLTLVMRNEG